MLILLLLLIFSVVITTINILYNKELKKSNQPPIEKFVQIGVSALIILALSCVTFFIVATSQPNPSDHYKPTVDDVHKAKQESPYKGKILYIQMRNTADSDGHMKKEYALYEENPSTKKLKQLIDFDEYKITYTTKPNASFTEYYGLNIQQKTITDLKHHPWLGYVNVIDKTKTPTYIPTNMAMANLIIPITAKNDEFIKISNVKLDYDSSIKDPLGLSKLD